VVALGTPIVSEAGPTITISPELSVADRVACPAEVAGMALAPGPAGESLVAWLDDRTQARRAEGIVVTRLAADGSILDPDGIFIADTWFASTSLAASFDGTRYLVVWSDDAGVHAARVGRDGAVLDEAPLLVSPDAALGVGAAAAEGQFLVSWRSDDKVRARRLTGAGTFNDSEPLVLGSGSFVLGGPSMIFDGTNFVVAWGAAGIHAARISPAGALVPPGAADLVPSIIGFQPYPAIVFSGSEYFVAWSAGGLYHMRVTPELTAIEVPVSYYGGGGSPALAFDGTRYMLAVKQDLNAQPGRLHVMYVSSANEYLELETHELPGVAGAGRPHVITHEAQQLLAFTSDQIIRGTRITAGGVFLDDPPLTWSQTRNDQRMPDVAFNGSDHHLVAWIDAREARRASSIFVGRFGREVAIDGAGVMVRSGIHPGGVAVARGRSSGSAYLVAWHESRELRAARISASGEVLDPGGFLISAEVGVARSYPLALACTIETCLLLWEDDGFNIRGIRVDMGGRVVDLDPIDFGRGISARVAAGEGSFLVSSSGGRSYLLPEERGQPVPIQLPATLGLGSWDIDWDGQHYLMAWSHGESSNRSIRAIHVDASGQTIGEPILVANVPGSSVFVEVAHDGSHSIVTWWVWAPDTLDRISAARISRNGVVLDPGGVEIILGAEASGRRRIADGTNGAFLVVQEVTTSATPDRGTRIGAWSIEIAGGGIDPTEDGPQAGCGCQGGGGGRGLPVLALAWFLRRARARAAGPRR
jgi:hypothetical protein